MGDTGSMFLGIMLGVIGCSFTMIRPTGMTFVAICFVLGVPMIDALLAIGRRIAMREPLFRADSMHIHHVLRQLGLSPRQTLAALYSMQAFLAVLGILVFRGALLPVIFGVAFFAVICVSFLRVMIVATPAKVTKPRVAGTISTQSIPTLESNIPTQNTTSSVGR